MEEKRIIVVDDSDEVRSVICESLRLAGYVVAEATNGLDGIALLESWPAQLALLDYDMPGLNGLETLRRIKKKQIDTDVIFVSAHTSVELIRRCLENGADDFVRKPFSMLELVTRVAVRFRIHELRRNLEIANTKLLELSDRDDLTGLFNMRALYRRMDSELDRARRTGSFVGCVMLDLDHFKKVNDSHDHLFGSYVIKEVAKVLSRSVRNHDSPARYGGDEYILLLVEVTEVGIQIVCDRIRETIDAYHFTDGVSSHHQTVSIGYAIVEANQVHDSSELIRAADNALYEAKKLGRNKVAGRNVSASHALLEQDRKIRKAG